MQLVGRLTGVQRAGLAGAVVAAAALGIAIGSETWAGLVPCALCLVERWPYRLAVVFGALSLASPRLARSMVALSAAVMLAGAVVGGVHVGVEQLWWPSPLPECAAPVLGGGTMAERLARMPARPAKPCDEPTYLVPFIPLSMAAMNMLLSSIMGAALATAALRRRSDR
jgi:disulfide bond formation protein DsbB